jgi:hypothetical protein
VINDITLSEWNACQLIEQLQPVSRRPAAFNGDIHAGIGENYDATLNVIKMFAGTGGVLTGANGHGTAIFGTLRTCTGG